MRTLCQQLEATWRVTHRDDYTIWYHSEPGELPAQPGRILLAWAGFPDTVFPAFGQLHPLEAEVLTLVMLRLLGKSYIFLSAEQLEQPEQYEALALHFSCELRKDETVAYPCFFCPPGQQHIYERFKDE